MIKRFHFWLILASVLQLFTGLVHSLSFFVEPEPANETERQLMDLMRNYHSDMGAGFHPSTREIFLALSSCFSLLCLLAGSINLALKRRKADSALWRPVLSLQLVCFGLLFLIMLRFAFLAPVLLVGLVTLSLAGARLTLKKETHG